MSATDGAVRALLMDKLKTGYRRPDHLATTVAEMVYLGELCDTLIRMHPTPDEFDHVWNEFKREWQRRYWPPFGELPGRLTKLRQRQAEQQRQAEAVKPEGGTYSSRHRKPERRYDHGAFMSTYGDLLEQSESENPAEAKWAQLFLAMGNALMERYDDNDQPRRPEADNTVHVPGFGGGRSGRDQRDLYTTEWPEEN